MSKTLWKTLALVLLSICVIGAALALPGVMFPALNAPSMSAGLTAHNHFDTPITLVITDIDAGTSVTAPFIEPGHTRQVCFYKGDDTSTCRVHRFAWTALAGDGAVLVSGLFRGDDMLSGRADPLRIAPIESPRPSN